MSDDPIDILNRFIISVVALLLVFAALLLVLLAWGATDGTIARVEDFAEYLRGHDGRDTKVIVTLGAVIAVFLLLALLIVQLTPSPLQKMRVRNVKAGDAVITTKEIAARIEEEARQAPHVRSAKATVATHGKKLDVVLDLHVEPAADLARTADEACRRAHELVERQIGVELAARPRARLHYRELRLGEGSADAPTGASREAVTGWERPEAGAQEELDDERDERTDRGSASPSEEAQA